MKIDNTCRGRKYLMVWISSLLDICIARLLGGAVCTEQIAWLPFSQVKTISLRIAHLVELVRMPDGKLDVWRKKKSKKAF